MPKVATELSAIAVKRITKPGMHAAGGVAGLYLQVSKSGARSWVLRTLVGGRRRDIGLGSYPAVSLAAAREKAQRDKEKIREGIDPVEERQRIRAELTAARAKGLMTFKTAAQRCFEAKQSEFKNPKHAQQWLRTLETYAYPVIGSIPVQDIDLPHVLKVLEPIWHTKTETATRVRQRMESALTWAKVSGYRTGENPARWIGNLKEVLPKPSKIQKTKHHPALPWKIAPHFMDKLRKRDGMGARALEFTIYTAARTGEVRFSKPSEFDLDAKLWTIPAERMKAGKAHRVPLSDDAVRLLRNLPDSVASEYVFSAPRGGVLSDASIGATIKRMDSEETPWRDPDGRVAVPHGFRSTFKDWARSCTRYADEVSELALAHVNSDATRAAYARDELIPQRTKLMREWCRYLNEGAATGSKVTQFSGRAKA